MCSVFCAQIPQLYDKQEKILYVGVFIFLFAK